jgi:hypothetical protein
MPGIPVSFSLGFYTNIIYLVQTCRKGIPMPGIPMSFSLGFCTNTIYLVQGPVGRASLCPSPIDLHQHYLEMR